MFFEILNCMETPISSLSFQYSVPYHQVLNCPSVLFLHKILISKLISSIYQILLSEEGIVHHTILLRSDIFFLSFQSVIPKK